MGGCIMKKVLAISALLIIVFISMTLLAYADTLSKYSIEDCRIYAFVNADGSMDIEEYITYNISKKHEGPIKWLIDISRASKLDSLEVFTVSQMDEEDITDSILEPCKLVDQPTEDMDRVYTMKPGTYPEETKEIDIYLSPNTDMKTIVMKYRLHDLVVIYRDTAALYWDCITKGHYSNIRNAEINVILPEGALKDDISCFAYGVWNAKSEVLDGGAVYLTGERFKSDESLEAVLVFPKSLVNQGRKLVDNDALNKILEEQLARMEELELSRQKKEQEQRMRIIAIIIIAMVIIGLGVAGYFWYTRYSARKREDRLSKDLSAAQCTSTKFSLSMRSKGITDIFAKLARTIEEIVKKLLGIFNEELLEHLPADYYTPAELSVLMHGKRITSRDMVATLTDLIIRRYLDIEAAEIDGIDCCVLYLKDDYSMHNLKPHEEYLLNWFFKDIGDGTMVSTMKINQTAYNLGTHTRFNNNFVTWKKLVLKQADRWKFWEMITPLKIYKRTTFGQKHYNEWRTFRKYLRRLNNQVDDLSLDKWEQYLVYSIPLGVAEKVIKGFREAFPHGMPLDDNLTLLNRINFSGLEYYLNFLGRFDIMGGKLMLRIQHIFSSILGVFGHKKEHSA
jgi:hypothetical protein